MSQIQLQNFILNDMSSSSKPLDVTLAGGQIVSLYGDMGSGCEQLLDVLFGERPPHQGKVRFNGEPLPHSATALEQWRNKGVITVAWDLPLIQWLTVFDNLSFALRIRGYSPKQTRQKIEASLAEDNLAALTDYYPDQLSSEQQIQLMLWRAYLCHAELILIDALHQELPTPLRALWYKRLDHLAHTRQCIILLHTTDLALLSCHSDYILFFSEGACITHGQPAQLLTESQLSQLTPLMSHINPLQSLSAGQLAKWPTLCVDIYTQTSDILTAMEQAKTSYAYVLDGKKLIGGLSLYQVNRAIQQPELPINKFLDMLPTIQAKNTLNEVIAQGPARQRDLAVIDEKDRYIGQLRHKQVLANLHDLLNNVLTQKKPTF